jgi:hypothetical protein
MILRFVAVGIAVATAALAADTSSTSSAVSFNKDVLPILQRNCQVCHRPGEIGPMSFLTYESTRPWAKAMRAAVLSRKMPPWFADPGAGHFANDRSLSPADINTIAAWADSGATEGNPQDKPAPLQWKQGWNIQPDLIWEMPVTYEIPAKGTVEYTYFVTPTGLKEDTWVTMGEVRPEARGNVHHVIAYVRPPGSTWMKDAKVGVPYVPPKRETSQTQPNSQQLSKDTNEFLVGYVPGMQPQRYDVDHSAKLIPAGSDIVFEVHYTTNGKAGQDRSKVGLTLAKAPPEKRFITLVGRSLDFAIPPGDPNYEAKSLVRFDEPVEFVEEQPHMHLRGKDMTVKMTYPTGESETILNVPHYDFNWQLVYYHQKPLAIPKGTLMEITSHWDNSPNNKWNPDPTATVRWGDQSWDEMLVNHFGVVVDRSTDVRKIIENLKNPAAQN